MNMAQDIELSDYSTIHETRRTATNSGDTEQSERRLFRIGILTLGVLCIIQATLNISLRLAFYSKEDTDQFPLSSVIAEVCQADQCEQNSAQLCPCCNDLVRRLLREKKAFETERDLLHEKILQITGDPDYFQESGDGALDDSFPEISGYS